MLSHHGIVPRLGRINQCFLNFSCAIGVDLNRSHLLGYLLLDLWNNEVTVPAFGTLLCFLRNG